MRLLLLSLLLSITALAQDSNSSNIITFNRADTEHCKVVLLGGKEFLETNNGGTSVAISLPVTMPNGEFQVYVSIHQIGAGSAAIEPKDFSSYFTDVAHTRFPFYDKATEIGIETAQVLARHQNAGTSSTNELAGTPPTPGSLNSNAWTGVSRRDSGRDPNAPPRREEEMRQQRQKNSQPDAASSSTAFQAAFLKQGTLQPGTTAGGLVFFKKPKGAKLKIQPQDVLYQIDIPVNGTVFRFK